MRHFRFHIGTIVILILLLAVGFAALRESNATWDSSIFSLTLGVLLIAIVLAVHRPVSRRAFWLGFALFGSTYLGLSLVPSIESRLITTKALAFLDSKVPRSIPGWFAYFDYDNDGDMDLNVVNNSQPPAIDLNQANGKFVDVKAVTVLDPAGKQTWFPNIFAGPSLTRSNGTTENFVRIGHSLLTLIATILGGLLSHHLRVGNWERSSDGPSPAAGPESAEHRA